MKHFQKTLSLIMIAAIALSLLSVCSFASASVKTGVSSSAVHVGDTVTVSFTFTTDKPTCVAEPWIKFDNSKFSFVSLASGGSASLITDDQIKISYYDALNTSQTYKVSATFKANAIGSGSFDIAFPEVGLTDLNFVSLGSPTASVSVTVKARPDQHLSSDCNLKSLTVPTGCTLVPAFSPNVTEYTCSVPADVESFPMDWKLSDSNAKDSVSGSVKLAYGVNKRSVKVVAQDGTAKTYTVTVTRAASPDTPTPTPTPTTEIPVTPSVKLIATVDGIEYEVMPTLSIAAPQGYELQYCMYNDYEIQTYVLGSVRLAELSDGTNSELYIFNVKSGTFEKRRTLERSVSVYTVLSPETILLPSNYKKTSISIGGNEYPAWQNDYLGVEYYVLYVLNELNGKEYLALYCTEDNSVQKMLNVNLFRDTPAMSEVTPQQVEKSDGIHWETVLIIAGGAAVAILIALLVIISVKRKKEERTLSERKHDWGFNDSYDFEESERNNTALNKTDSTKTDSGAKGHGGDNDDDEPTDLEFEPFNNDFE